MAGFTWTSKIDSKCRVTIPSEVRDRLGLGEPLKILIKNVEVRRKEASNVKEAKAFLNSFSDVESFSFDDEEVKVVLRE